MYNLEVMQAERQRGLSPIERLGDGLLEGRVRRILQEGDLTHLREANEHLKSGGSLIIAFNHPSVLDPRYMLVVCDMLTEGVPDSRVSALASVKFAEGRMKGLSSVHETVTKEHGVELFYVVQGYELSGLQGEERQKAAELNTRSLLQVLKTLRSPGGILLVAPEGTRSKKGRIGKGLEIVGKLFEMAAAKRGEKVLCLPIGIEVEGFPQDLESLSPVKKLEFFLWLARGRVDIHIGELLSYEELRETGEKKGISVVDTVMLRIAKMLPMKYWGHYGKNLV